MKTQRGQHVRIEGPDSTKQWRVVRVLDGDVLFDGFSLALHALRWAESLGLVVDNLAELQRNPYWLQGSERRFFVTPKSRMTKREKDDALALIGHVEFEDEPEARKRRKQQKDQKRAKVSARMAKIARRPRTMLRRIVELGGLQTESMRRTYPGDWNPIRDAKVRGLVRPGGLRWEEMVEQLRSEGYIRKTSGDPSREFVELLTDSVNGTEVYSALDGDAVREREQRELERAHMARSRGAPRRKANPHLLTLGNPSKVTSEHVRAAIAAYKRFHGVEPKPGQIHRGDGNGILIALGELCRVDYKPRRGDRSGPTWFHHFKPGAVLCTSPDGRRLVVLDRHGKRLVDFDRGIVR